MTQKKGLLHEVFQLRATALVIMSAVSLQAPLPPLTRSPSPVATGEAWENGVTMGVP